MFRFISHIFGLNYEPCKGCQILLQQLEYERLEKKQLTDTLLNILQPKVVESAPVEISPVVQTSALFSRRRAALESRDREQAKILSESKHIGKPDNVEDLEKELGVIENAN